MEAAFTQWICWLQAVAPCPLCVFFRVMSTAQGPYPLWKDREGVAQLWRRSVLPGCIAQVGMWGEGGPGTSGGGVSRSCPLQRPDAPTMAADALRLVRARCSNPLLCPLPPCPGSANASRRCSLLVRVEHFVA